MLRYKCICDLDDVFETQAQKLCENFFTNLYLVFCDYFFGKMKYAYMPNLENAQTLGKDKEDYLSYLATYICT